MEKYLTQEESQSLKNRVLSCRNNQDLPSHDAVFSLIDRAITVLEKEHGAYRPEADNKTPGGLLDFTGEPFAKLPVLVVPDLHGRSDFLIKLMESSIVSPTVFDALNEKRVIVVCVGDGVHAESRAYERWQKAYEDWNAGIVDGESMTQEMQEDIATMQGVMELKCAFPEHFHFLKGNHENILDEEGDGDHSFRKFALEGEMVKDFVREVYGDDILHLESCFEKTLPICAICSTCGISHAEPFTAYKKSEIVNYHKNPSLILGFTWTANGDAEEDSVEKLFHLLNKKNKEVKPLWLGGHRPVEEKYLLRQNGKYVQIHNPDEMNVALVTQDHAFDPEKDIHLVLGGE